MKRLRSEEREVVSYPPEAVLEVKPAIILVPGLRPIFVFPREAVLGIKHVAAALGISSRMVERRGYKCFYIGERTRRYLWGSVLDECAEMMK